MAGPCFGYLLLERAERLAIVAGGDRRDGSLEGTGFLDALRLHVFEKLRSGFGLPDQIENCLDLTLVDRSANSVVIISDHDDVEDVARDVAAQKGIGAPYRLHARLATCGVRRGRHKGVFVMAAWQVLQPAADQDAAALLRLVRIGEIHLLFRQQWAQMSVDLLQGRVLERCIAALLPLPVLDFAYNWPGLNDL